MPEEQVYYEDIEVGAPVPTLVKQPTRRQLVQWAVASGDLTELHYDKDAAVAAGLPDVIVHGRLKAAFLGQLLTDWVGPGGRIRRWACSYRGLDLPDQPIACGGKVVRKYLSGADHCLDLEIWIENAKGERTTTGTATLAVPARDRG